VRRILFVLFFIFFFGVKNVWASCTVSVSPGNVVTGVSSVSTFTVNNTGEQMINWVKIQSPGLSSYTIANMEATGWYPNGGGTEANFAGGYLEGGSSANFALMLAETGEEATSMSWEALASYDGGENFESCGSVDILIESLAVPEISNAAITVGNTSAVLTWNSSLTATGTVNYGTTSGYGSSVTTSSGTSHSATLSSLSPSTTYHYQISVTSEGGTTSSTDATFTTSTADVVTTVTNTVTTTTTTTNTVTNTNTVTRVLKDVTVPKISISTKFDRPLESAPAVSGRVIDGGEVNAGIAAIEYSIDGGKNWAKVDEIDNWVEKLLDLNLCHQLLMMVVTK
jgi:hypothetical protein